MKRSTLGLLATFMLQLACTPNSLVGQPCDDAGKTTCEGTASLRCDGEVWAQLASCSSACVADLDATDHAGILGSDETWRCEDGPHRVTETMTLAAATTLTIEAGARVQLLPAARIVADVGARVDAAGTQQATILFTSDNGEASGYGGTVEGGLNVFAVESGAGAVEPSHLTHVVFERGINGLGVFGLSATASPPVVENNTFRDNTNFGIVITCNSAAPPIPDFAASGNQFFHNGGDVSPCP